jgi:hypothetical protein
MDNTQPVRRNRSSLLWPATGGAAFLAGAGGLGSLWAQPAATESWAVLTFSALFVLIAVFGFVAFIRARARHRLEAIVEAYADLEIARERRPESLLPQQSATDTAKA